MKQQRRKSSYSQVPLSAPKVPANMAWQVQSVEDNVVILQILQNFEKAFIVGCPNFLFNQPSLSAISAVLAGDQLTVICTRALDLPVVMTLGVNDPSVRNYYGGYLSSQQVDIVPAPVVPQPFSLGFRANSTYELDLQNITDSRDLFGSPSVGVYVNGVIEMMQVIQGANDSLAVVYGTPWNSGDVVSWNDGDLFVVAQDGGKVAAGSITIP